MRIPVVLFPFVVSCFAACLPAWSAEPLHARIDTIIAREAGGALNPAASDAEFLRRVYLDLAGRIPSAREARTFLADGASDKRTQLIDRLLAGPEYPWRMQHLLHVMLMERRGDNDDWARFLRDSFARNKPWDQMVCEILSPDAEDETARGAAFFYTKRLEKYGQNPTDYPGLVRDVGRLFLGVDVQCAECHDHIFVDDYKQADYQGLFAFLGQVYLRTDTSFPSVGQNPLTGKLEFTSAFESGKWATGPRLPWGEEVEIPSFPKGEEFLVPPDKKQRTPGVLKFDPLKILARQVASADNAAFKKNIANRLWWVMTGRGLVEPLDMHHGENPASHPGLLDLLADEFAAHQFDIRWFLRELALTETYQRSSVLPEGAGDLPPESFRAALERPLAAEQLLLSVLQACGPPDRATGFSLSESGSAAADPSTNLPPPTDELLARFRAALGKPAREPEVEISPTVQAALFFCNDDVLLGCLRPRPGTLVGRLVELKEAGQVAEELYLSVLSRMPEEEEVAEVAELLGDSAEDRAKRITQLAWALLASTEFLVNH